MESHNVGKLSVYGRGKRVFIFGLFFVSASALGLPVRPGGTAALNPPQGNGERLLKKGAHRKPVTEIVGLKVKGNAVEFGRKIDADDDWLKGLTVTVRNVSSEPIVYLELEVRVFGDKEDKEAAGKLPVIYPLSYGNYHSTDPTQAPAPAPPQTVEPGSTLDITLTDKDYEFLMSALSANAYPLTIKYAELSVTDIIFADGTRWYKGMRLRRDPKNPAEWLTSKEVGRRPNPDKKLINVGGRGPYAAKAAFFLPVSNTQSRQPFRRARYSGTARACLLPERRNRVRKRGRPKISPARPASPAASPSKTDCGIARGLRRRHDCRGGLESVGDPRAKASLAACQSRSMSSFGVTSPASAAATATCGRALAALAPSAPTPTASGCAAAPAAARASRHSTARVRSSTATRPSSST